MNNEEIKEILDNFKNYEERYKKCNENQFIIFYRDIHLLLDYITNLQKKVNQYENPDDLTLFYMWLDEKAKDKMKELKEKYDKALELLVDHNIPCELNDFNIHQSDYCQNHCTIDDDQFKKCWDKYIEWETKRK